MALNIIGQTSTSPVGHAVPVTSDETSTVSTEVTYGETSTSSIDCTPTPCYSQTTTSETGDRETPTVEATALPSDPTQIDHAQLSASSSDCAQTQNTTVSSDYTQLALVGASTSTGYTQTPVSGELTAAAAEHIQQTYGGNSTSSIDCAQAPTSGQPSTSTSEYDQIPAIYEVATAAPTDSAESDYNGSVAASTDCTQTLNYTSSSEHTHLVSSRTPASSTDYSQTPNLFQTSEAQADYTDQVYYSTSSVYCTQTHTSANYSQPMYYAPSMYGQTPLSSTDCSQTLTTSQTLTASDNSAQLACGQTSTLSTAYPQTSTSDQFATSLAEYAQPTYSQMGASSNDYYQMPTLGQISTTSGYYTQPTYQTSTVSNGYVQSPSSGLYSATVQARPSYSTHPLSGCYYQAFGDHSHTSTNYGYSGLFPTTTAPPTTSLYTAGQPPPLAQATPVPISTLLSQPPSLHFPPPSLPQTDSQLYQAYNGRYDANYNNASGENYDRSYSQCSDKPYGLDHSGRHYQYYDWHLRHGQSTQDYNRSSGQDINRPAAQDNNGALDQDYKSFSEYSYNRYPRRSFNRHTEGPFLQCPDRRSIHGRCNNFHRRRDGRSVRAMNWICPNLKCKNNNFSWRSECNRCHVSRPEAGCRNLQSENNSRGFERDEDMCRRTRGGGARGNYYSRRAAISRGYYSSDDRGTTGRAGSVRERQVNERIDRRPKSY